MSTGTTSSLTCESATFTVDDGLARVALRLRNDGEAPLYVVSQMRRLALEDGGTTLVLWLTERGAPEGSLRQLSTPVVTALGAGQTEEIAVELPARMTHRSEAPPGERGGLGTLNLATAERAVVHLSVAATPFRVHPAKEDLLHELQHWGEDLEIHAERHRPD